MKESGDCSTVPRAIDEASSSLILICIAATTRNHRVRDQLELQARTSQALLDANDKLTCEPIERLVSQLEDCSLLKYSCIVSRPSNAGGRFPLQTSKEDREGRSRSVCLRSLLDPGSFEEDLERLRGRVVFDEPIPRFKQIYLSEKLSKDGVERSSKQVKGSSR